MKAKGIPTKSVGHRQLERRTFETLASECLPARFAFSACAFFGAWRELGALRFLTIPGSVVSLWPQIKNLIYRAHRKYDEHVTAGFDAVLSAC